MTSATIDRGAKVTCRRVTRMRACVYTSIFGGYDPLREQPAQSISTDFICITESDSLAAAHPWSIAVNNDRPELNPRIRAKYFKILSHRIFPGGFISRELLPHNASIQTEAYDYIIYIDASIQILSADFVEMIVSQIPSRGWTMVVHPERDCIYPEVSESLRIWPKKYAPSRILEQSQRYRSEGYPEHHGLFATGIIGRKADDAALSEVNEAWWREIVQYDSPQCQVSLPVVLWRIKKSPVIPIDINVYGNQYFRWIRHDRDD
jgi:hypothetical protein